MSFSSVSASKVKELKIHLNQRQDILAELRSVKSMSQYWNTQQREQDQRALNQLTPYIRLFVEELNSMLRVVADLSNLLSTRTPTLPAKTSDLQQLISQLNETAFDSQLNVARNFSSRHGVPLLESIGRIFLFEALRLDTENTTWAWTVLGFYQFLAKLRPDIESKTAELEGKINAPLVENVTELVDLLKSSLSATLAAGQQLIDVGLRDVHVYVNQSNIPKLSSILIDETFVRENLLRVSVFFKDMSYQSISQKLSDSLVSLICDLGGMFGLFLGASVMSLYEFVDIFLYMVAQSDP